VPQCQYQQTLQRVVEGVANQSWLVLRIVLGSASELDYHIILSTDLCYLNKSVSQQLFKQLTEVKRMLTSLIQKLTADR
jgi:four helix bundle protein